MNFRGIWRTADGSRAVVTRFDGIFADVWLGSVNGTLAEWDCGGNCTSNPLWNLVDRERSAEGYGCC